MKLSTLFESNPYTPGLRVVNTRWIGCRRVSDNKPLELHPFTEIEFIESKSHYGQQNDSLFDTKFKANGVEYFGMYSSEDLNDAFFKGTKREYHQAFLNSLKDTGK